MRYLIFAAVLAGCGSSNEPETFDCEPSDINGVYYVEWEHVDGDCATPSDGLLPLSITVDSEGCTVTSFMQDGCRFTQLAECDDNASTANVFEQLDEDGDRFRGTVTFNLPLTCRGTFRISGTRQ